MCQCPYGEIPSKNVPPSNLLNEYIFLCPDRKPYLYSLLHFFQISQQKLDEIFEIQKQNDLEFHSLRMENEKEHHTERMTILAIEKETAEIRRKIAQKELEKNRNQGM